MRGLEILSAPEILGAGFLREWVLPVDRGISKSELGEAAVAVPAAPTATFKVCRSNLAEEDSPTRFAMEEVEKAEFWKEIIALVGVDGHLPDGAHGRMKKNCGFGV